MVLERRARTESNSSRAEAAHFYGKGGGAEKNTLCEANGGQRPQLFQVAPMEPEDQ